MYRRTFLALASLAIASSAALGADWPQWRGPQRTGISQETGLLKQWPAGGPRLVWQVNGLGGGYSTPAVVGERLYLISDRGPDNEFVQALSPRNGAQVWTASLGRVGPNLDPAYPGARSTPTVDGALLYALGSDGDLVCLETATGKLRWRKSLRADFGGKPGRWAYAESPLVDGDAVICTPGGTDATLVAPNKRTGQVIWRSAVPGGDESAYSSAIVLNTGGVKQYVQFLQKGVVGVDAKTGRFLWRYDRTAQGSPANIPTPVAADNMVYTATRRAGGGLVKLAVNGSAVNAEQVYFSARLPSAIGGTVKIGPYLYGTTDQALLCVAFETGEVKWQERAIGAASLLFADGHLYLHGENGQVALVEATPDGYREKGRFTPPGIPDRGKSAAWAYPVVANGRLYIHDYGTLWCYDVREGAR